MGSGNRGPLQRPSMTPHDAMEILPHPRIHDPACRVRVTARGAHRALLAAVDIPAGAAVLFFDGEVVGRPSRYSVQVGVDRHVDVGGGHEGDERFVWRFLNHSCQPNSVPHERMLVARRDIAAGEEVTFDYDANEWDMAEPFACACGAAACRGVVRGFRHLGAEDRRRIAPIVSPHIAALAGKR